MNISSFFINKPIFASVISIIIFLAGLISVGQLPIAEYPEVSPPSINVRASYPGANPKVISETVAAPLEEAINGVEDMLYMSSQAGTDGSLNITVTFKLGADADKAQNLVQNRVSQALPRLPDIVRTLGVTTIKATQDLTMVVHLYSPNERYDNLYLRNYAVLNVKDVLGRIQGVGDARIFGGGDYAMRIWLDPQKVAARGLNASDVVNSIKEQNLQVAVGVIGMAPSSPIDVNYELPINAQGRLEQVEEFEDIIVKTEADGSVTRLKDVGRVELGSSDYGMRSLLNNKSAVAIAIFQAPDSNAIEVSNNVRAAMKQIKKGFPEDVQYKIVYDPTIFVRQSIEKVIHTLLEAIILVVIVVIIFLQTWRASIIPLLAVPISVVGTFAFMHLFGFSINALSLFGLVLSIGVVVDDAIVVVENVERNISNGLNPHDATIQAMKEVSGPIIAIALVLCAVFIPIAFVSGLTGKFYQQFALTIAISTIISAFNSLTLSPALASILLKGHDEPKDWLTRVMDKLFGWFFERFNRFFKRASTGYSNTVGKSMNFKFIAMIVYLVLISFTYYAFQKVPAGYVPTQDKQYLIAFANLPGGVSLDRSEQVIREMSDIALKQPGVANAVEFPGLSIAGFSRAPNAGVVFVPLTDFKKRTTDATSAFGIAGALNQKFAGIKDAFIQIFPPPPVRGLGTIGGFKVQVEDRAGLGWDGLNDAVQKVIAKAYQTPELANIFSGYQVNIPQLNAEVNRTQAKQLGVPITSIFDTMQIYLGSYYVNDFNKFGRTFQVIAQADAPFRAHPDNISELKVRNLAGDMVPLGSVLKVTETYGPDRTMRYNAYRAADINGAPAPGYSSGQAKAAMERILEETLPKGMSYEWTELTYQQILAGDTGTYIFPLCVFLVFLVLAALYESLSMPLAVILIVPMCLFCSISGVWIMGRDNNIFTQIGFIVLVGLACKNAILIVEFARELEHKGMGIVDAAIEASHLRLRPILMTSLAFIMGVVPLVTSTGAGAEMRQAMGIAVFSGMLGVTFFGLLLTPIFYVLVRKYVARGKKVKV